MKAQLRKLSYCFHGMFAALLSKPIREHSTSQLLSIHFTQIMLLLFNGNSLVYGSIPIKEETIQIFWVRILSKDMILDKVSSKKSEIQNISP